jgi:hypothetical protein
MTPSVVASHPARRGAAFLIIAAMAMPAADPKLPPMRSRIARSACGLPKRLPATAMAISSVGAIEKTM